MKKNEPEVQKTTTIQLEIHPDKVAEFYYSLLSYKKSKNGDFKSLKKMADAIVIGNILFDDFALTNEMEQKKDAILLNIHNFLLKSSKKSADYSNVGRENFERFKLSPFINALEQVITLNELSKKRIGKENNMDTKLEIAAYAAIGFYFMNLESGALTLERSEPSIEPAQNGNVYILEQNSNIIEFEVYVKKREDVLKKFVTLNNLKKIFSEPTIYSVFLRYNNIALQFKKENKNLVIIALENVSIKNEKLDLSKAKISSTNVLNKKTIAGYIKAAKDRNLKQFGPKKDFEFDYVAYSNFFNAIEKQVSVFLKLPKDSREETESRDRIILIIDGMLMNHYPEITRHSASTITGYISSSIELLDNEEEHNESKRVSSFREYLRNTVNNILANPSRKYH